MLKFIKELKIYVSFFLRGPDDKNQLTRAALCPRFITLLHANPDMNISLCNSVCFYVVTREGLVLQVSSILIRYCDINILLGGDHAYLSDFVRRTV